MSDDRPPVTRFQLDRVKNDKCPKCRGGELDTGYECNFCGYDAGWLSSYVTAADPSAPGAEETA